MVESKVIDLSIERAKRRSKAEAKISPFPTTTTSNITDLSVERARRRSTHSPDNEMIRPGFMAIRYPNGVTITDLRSYLEDEVVEIDGFPFREYLEREQRKRLDYPEEFLAFTEETHLRVFHARCMHIASLDLDSGQLERAYIELANDTLDEAASMESPEGLIDGVVGTVTDLFGVHNAMVILERRKAEKDILEKISTTPKSRSHLTVIK